MLRAGAITSCFAFLDRRAGVSDSDRRRGTEKIKNPRNGQTLDDGFPDYNQQEKAFERSFGRKDRWRHDLDRTFQM